MRFIIFGIFSFLWFGMWIWVYPCHIKGVCCDTPSAIAKEPATVVPERDLRNELAIVFESGDKQGERGGAFDSLVAQLDSAMGAARKLEITGLIYENEESAGPGLALGRALAAGRLLAGRLDSTRFTYAEDRRVGMPGDSLFEAVDFRVYRDDDFILETGDRVVFYFPFNSTEHIVDPSVEQYLYDLAGELNGSSAGIRITGHSDAFGPADENYLLALWRAESIRDILLKNGVDASRITVISKGEEEPVATNTTPEGAAQNRRVELEIIESSE